MGDQLASDADVDAAASARRIAHFVEQRDLDDVTIVANDTGGGIVLTMLVDQTLDLSRIRRLVLTNCDSYEHFPPGSSRPIVKICRASAGIGGVILAGLASKRGQKVLLKAVCAFPNSTLVTIPHSATYVMLDAPDQLAAAITEFIKPSGPRDRAERLYRGHR